MDKKIALATFVALVLLAGSAFAYMGGPGYGMGGMMGWYGNQYTTPGYGSQYARPFGGWGYGMMGPGMMGGYGSRGYGGYGCSGLGYGYGAAANPITIEEAKEAVEKYLAAAGNADLKLTEVMEFDNHFYAEVEEKSTGIHAFELLVDKYTGAITPEMGPNMMWNTKYGYMSSRWGVPTQTTVTKEQALQYAQKFLDTALPGTKADEADAFYGYYTIHVLKDGKIYGMLSVNAYTGAVWYHSWHGKFIKMLEAE